MNDTIRELTQEAHEMLVHARAAYANGEITREQMDEVIRNLIYDVCMRAEIITES